MENAKAKCQTNTPWVMQYRPCRSSGTESAQQYRTAAQLGQAPGRLPRTHACASSFSRCRSVWDASSSAAASASCCRSAATTAACAASRSSCSACVGRDRPMPVSDEPSALRRHAATFSTCHTAPTRHTAPPPAPTLSRATSASSCPCCCCTCPSCCTCSLSREACSASLAVAWRGRGLHSYLGGRPSWGRGGRGGQPWSALAVRGGGGVAVGSSGGAREVWPVRDGTHLWCSGADSILKAVAHPLAPTAQTPRPVHSPARAWTPPRRVGRPQWRRSAPSHEPEPPAGISRQTAQRAAGITGRAQRAMQG